MGAYHSGISYKEDPVLTIKIRDTDGKLKECSMGAMDKTPESKSYKCAIIQDQNNIMKMESVSFKVEDKTEPNTGKPERVKNFFPVTCFANTISYRCDKRLTLSVSRSKTFSIGSGLSMSASFGTKTSIETGIFGNKLTAELSTQLSSTSSFNVESSETKEEKVRKANNFYYSQI